MFLNKFICFIGEEMKTGVVAVFKKWCWRGVNGGMYVVKRRSESESRMMIVPCPTPKVGTVGKDTRT